MTNLMSLSVKHKPSIFSFTVDAINTARSRTLQPRVRGILSLVALALVFGAPSPARAQTAQVRYSQTTIDGGFTKPSSLAIDTAGNLYVGDAAAGGVGMLYKVTLANGAYTHTVIPADFQAQSMAVDSNGNIFATQYGSVYELALANGVYTEVHLGPNVSALAVAVDAANNLYVVEGDGVVKGTVANGAYTSSVIIPALFLSYTNSMAVDASGNIFIADTGNNRILMATLGGGTYTISTIGSGFSAPDSVSVDAAGNVYVLDSLHFQIVKETLSGGTYTQSVMVPVGYQDYALVADAAGNVYYIDGYSSLIKVSPIEEADAPAIAFGTSNVGTQTGNMTASFKFLDSGQLAATPYTVLTQGDPTLDFQPAATQASTQCITGHAYQAGDVCTVAVTFKPIAPGARYGAIQLTNPSGLVVGTGFLTGFGVGPLASRPLVAGSTNYIDVLSGLAIDSSGNLYYADRQGGVLQENAVTGATKYPLFGHPPGVVGGTGALALDGSGNLYSTDTYATVATENVLVNGTFTTTIAIGSGLNDAQGLAVDGNGNVYIADTNNNRVLKETLSGGTYTQTVLGSGFSGPSSVVVDINGNVFIADRGNDRVVQETPSGSTYTQTVLTTNVNLPVALVLDGLGNLYISDYNNKRILRETLESGAYTESIYAPATSKFGQSPQQLGFLTIDPYGNIYGTGYAFGVGGFIASLSVQRQPALSFANTAVGNTSSDSPQATGITNIGNAPLTFSVPSTGLNPVITPGFQYSASSTCPQLSTTSTAATLAPNASCTQLISFVPVAPGNITGTLTTTDNNLSVAGATQIVTLNGTATGSAAATATLTPAANFGSVAIGSTSSSTLTLTNTGSSAITITGVAISSTLFTLTSQTCGSTLAAAASCTYTLTFTPTAIAPATSSFTVTDDAGTQTSALTGTGTAAPTPQAVLTPAALSFTSVANSVAYNQTATLSNPGTGPLAIASVALSGTSAASFSIVSNTCSASLAAGASCSITIGPTVIIAGTYAATLTVTDNASTGSQTIALTDAVTGTPQAVLAPSSLTFTTTVGTSSPSQAATLTNSGTAALTISSIALSGTGAGAFSESNTCGASLGAGSSCSINVAFASSIVGSFSASLVVTDNSATTTQTVTLTGTATLPASPQAALSPASANFGGVTTGSTSAAQTFTLVNAGNAPLAITSIGIGGANATSFRVNSNTCGTTLPAAASCTVTISFIPASAGSLAAILSVVDSVGTQTSSLSGAGASATPPDFTIDASPAAQGTYRGASVSYTIQLASLLAGNPFNSLVTLSASGLPAGATATFSPASVTPGTAPQTTVLTIAVPALVGQVEPPQNRRHAPGGITLALAVLGIAVGRRKRLGVARLLSVLLLIGMAGLGLAINGCGTGNGFAVPSSLSTINITATGGSTTHSTSVTLTIQ